MTAGRELDALVAEKVFGWSLDPGLYDETAFWYPPEWNTELKTWPSTCGRQQKGPYDLIPQYSDSIADAWQVVEKMKASHGIAIAVYQDGSARVEMSLSCLSYDDENIVAVSNTAPLAICLAALKAVGVEVGS